MTRLTLPGTTAPGLFAALLFMVAASSVPDSLSAQQDSADEPTGDYSFSDRDFNVRSLIGNAVLRWEYRPGSTLFLVWQRRQADRVVLGDFDFGRDLGALLDAPADDSFIIKVNYWLGL